jgi:hypothetical protein
MMLKKNNIPLQLKISVTYFPYKLRVLKTEPSHNLNLVKPSTQLCIITRQAESWMNSMNSPEEYEP